MQYKDVSNYQHDFEVHFFGPRKRRPASQVSIRACMISKGRWGLLVFGSAYVIQKDIQNGTPMTRTQVSVQNSEIQSSLIQSSALVSISTTARCREIVVPCMGLSDTMWSR